MLGILISRSAARWCLSIVIGRKCTRESLQTAVQTPLVNGASDSDVLYAPVG